MIKITYILKTLGSLCAFHVIYMISVIVCASVRWYTFPNSDMMLHV